MNKFGADNKPKGPKGKTVNWKYLTTRSPKSQQKAKYFRCSRKLSRLKVELEKVIPFREDLNGYSNVFTPTKLTCLRSSINFFLPDGCTETVESGFAMSGWRSKISTRLVLKKKTEIASETKSVSIVQRRGIIGTNFERRESYEWNFKTITCNA